MFDAIYFELTEEHVKLIREFNISWAEGYEGAPCVNTKRPFGNGDVYGDIANILGIEEIEHDDMDDVKVYPLGTHERLEKLYAELEQALQVVLASGSFEVGTYTAQQYLQDWKFVTQRASDGM